jgi:hypothetical protein
MSQLDHAVEFTGVLLELNCIPFGRPHVTGFSTSAEKGRVVTCWFRSLGMMQFAYISIDTK